MTAHIVVIGGGITGLAAVERLTRSAPSTRVTLLEASGRLGGHIRTEQADGLVMEAGPDVLLAAKPAAIELAQRVGLGDRLRGTSPSARGSYIWTERGLVRLPDGMTGLVPSRAWPFVTTPLLSPVAKLRVALEYFISPVRDESDESVQDFVVRRLGREMYDRLAQPLLSGISAGDGARLSMVTMFPQLRALEREHGGLVRGMIATRRKRVRTPTTGWPSPFVSFPTGLSELVDGVVRAVGARDPNGGRVALRTKARVSAITVAGSGKREAGSGNFSIQLANGELIAADAIVLATPTYMAGELLGPIHRELSARLAEIEYGSVATVSLAYPLAAVSRALDATGYVVPQRAGRAVLACTWASAKFDDRASRDRALFRVFVGGALHAALDNASDAELRDLAVREMTDAMGINAEPLVCRVNRFTRAMPQYHVGHQSRIRTIESLAAQLPGLQLAGAAYDGVGIPDCVRSGDRAAAALLTYLDARASSLSPSPT